MKTLSFILAIVLIMAGIHSGQTQNKAPAQKLNKREASNPQAINPGNSCSPGSVKGMWDIKLFWDLENVTGGGGHAGIIYLNTTGDV